MILNLAGRKQNNRERNSGNRAESRSPGCRPIDQELGIAIFKCEIQYHSCKYQQTQSVKDETHKRAYKATNDTLQKKDDC